MKDGVGDRGIYADISQFADTLDAKLVDEQVLLGNENGLDLPDIRGDRDQIAGEIGIHIASPTGIDLRGFMQGGAHAPDLRPHELALGGERTDNASGGKDTQQARDADLPSALVHANLHKLGPERTLDALLEKRAAGESRLTLVHTFQTLRRCAVRGILRIGFNGRATEACN